MKRIHRRSGILTIVRNGDIRLFVAAGAVCAAAAITGTCAVALAGPTFGVLPLSLIAAAGLSIGGACTVAKLDTRPMVVKSSEEVKKDILNLERLKEAQGEALTKHHIARYISDEITRFGFQFCRNQGPGMAYHVAIFGNKYGTSKAVPRDTALEHRPPYIEQHPELFPPQTKAIYEPIQIESRHRELFGHNKAFYPHILVSDVTCEPLAVKEQPPELPQADSGPGIHRRRWVHVLDPSIQIKPRFLSERKHRNTLSAPLRPKTPITGLVVMEN